MNENDAEKLVKEILKKILDNNEIPRKAKEDLKLIIESERNPERLLQECLIYMLTYK